MTNRRGQPGTASAIPRIMSNQVALTIKEQIGHRAFFMLGAKDLTAYESGLGFKVGRNAKSVNHVVVTLEPDDTYTVKAERVCVSRKTFTVSRKVLGEVSDVYVDSLHTVIESLTGMYTSL